MSIGTENLRNHLTSELTRNLSSQEVSSDPKVLQELKREEKNLRGMISGISPQRPL